MTTANNSITSRNDAYRHYGESTPFSRLNVGCGATPTPGWKNVDNSVVVLLGRVPLLLGLLRRLRLFGPERAQLVAAVDAGEVRWGHALRLAEDDGSVEILYSSHMLEHLDRAEARAFLAEALRALAPGGTLRLVVPDLALLIRRYVETGDSNEFLEATHLVATRPKSLLAKLRWLLVGDRHHAWMYDETSLVKLLEESGFHNITPLPAGQTHIADPGDLDLRERETESLYVEARAPTRVGSSAHVPSDVRRDRG